MSQAIACTEAELPGASDIPLTKTSQQENITALSEGPTTLRLRRISGPVPTLSTPKVTAQLPGLSDSNAAISQGILLGKKASILLIFHVFLVYTITSVANGLITIGIPAISNDVELDQSLIYWPILIYTLTSAAFLLPAGAIADVVGRRITTLFSLLFLGMFNLGCGLSRTGQQLITFRAMGGIAMAFFLPTSVGLISTNIAEGQLRNIGFSMLGIGQLVGYALGLVLGGVFVNTVGWRVGYYVCGAFLLALLITGFLALPPDRRIHSPSRSIMHELRTSIDWVGIFLSSSALAMLAYVLAQISVAASNVKQPSNIAILTISLILIPTCALWFGKQERNGKPALIPNSLWRHLPFSAICVMIMLDYAEMQTMELLTSLFFQQIQGLSAIQASIRLLPSLVVGVILEIGTAALAHRVPAIWLVLPTSILSAAAPVLMAVTQPNWPYWWTAFPAQVLYPLSVEVLFTIALLLISSVFPPKDQALAGAVFSVTGVLGQALGLAIISVITNTVTEHDSGHLEVGQIELALLKGYRAGFWTAFAWVVTLCVICVFGLRKVGKVGGDNNDDKKKIEPLEGGPGWEGLEQVLPEQNITVCKET